MSQQAQDLRMSTQIVRRHKILVGILVALGILGGAAYATLNPPMLTSTALVALPAQASAQTATDRRRNRSLYGNPKGSRDQLSGASECTAGRPSGYAAEPAS